MPHTVTAMEWVDRLSHTTLCCHLQCSLCCFQATIPNLWNSIRGDLWVSMFRGNLWEFESGVTLVSTNTLCTCQPATSIRISSWSSTGYLRHFAREITFSLQLAHEHTQITREMSRLSLLLLWCCYSVSVVLILLLSMNCECFSSSFLFVSVS